MFDPFGKGADSPLNESDLQSLITNSVSEGYFVEYKGAFPAPKKIAEKLASLANTHGGWFIVGVNTDEHHKANDIVGYDPSALQNGVGHIRHIVRDHLSPALTFHAQTISLQNGKHVLVVNVPEAESKPILTKDGRIYRRLGDMSDPVSTLDRYELDRMYDTVQVAKTRWQAFAQDDRPLEATKSAWLNVYFRPVQYRDAWLWSTLTARQLQELLEASTATTKVRLPGIIGSYFTINPSIYDHVMNGLNSIEFKQRRQGSPFNRMGTLQFYRNGSGKIHLPIKSIETSELERLLVQQANLKTVLETSGLHAFHYTRLFDVGELFTVAMVAVATYDQLLSHFGMLARLSGVEYAVEVTNLDNMAPIVFDQAYEDYVNGAGIPVIQHNYQRLELPDGRGLVAKLPDEGWYTLPIAQCMGATGLPTDLLARAVGQYIMSKRAPDAEFSTSEES